MSFETVALMRLVYTIVLTSISYIVIARANIRMNISNLTRHFRVDLLDDGISWLRCILTKFPIILSPSLITLPSVEFA